jgi:hypothetical protein
MTFEQYFRLWLLLRHMREERDREAKLQELREYSAMLASTL